MYDDRSRYQSHCIPIIPTFPTPHPPFPRKRKAETCPTGLFTPIATAFIRVLGMMFTNTNFLHAPIMYHVQYTCLPVVLRQEVKNGV